MKAQYLSSGYGRTSRRFNRKRGRTFRTHDISFYCDNIQETVSELKAKGVEFKGEIADHGYGFVIYFKERGNFYLQLLNRNGK